MKNGMFTPKERERLSRLDAVLEVRARQIVYSPEFKKECMRRYRAGERPGVIFASAGLPASLISHKRIERAVYHWKHAEEQGSLGAVKAPSVRHASRIRTLKDEKRRAVERQRAIRRREVEKLKDRLERRKAQAKSREERTIASQAARIKALEDQVKALKANGARARQARRAPGTTPKTLRFQVIADLRAADPSFNVSAACQALEVSRSGYYDWENATPARAARLDSDERDARLVAEAFHSHRARKGNRQVVDALRREHGTVMNRKKVRRLMHCKGLTGLARRRRSYHPVTQDGTPRIATNEVDRDFRQGAPRRVLSTDIAYLPCTAARHGFMYPGAVIDCQTNRILAWNTSENLAEPLVLDTLDQPGEQHVTDQTWICSDQGVHYTARAYRDKLAD
ncbi:IS3 family transposase [Bifidobacterium thermophilum]|uniref:Transposase for insertion sequence element IS3 family protein n=2 Tax=Bifidobacterium thermophilum TaxID=33905 RepID=M4REK2_9BIFI|nr:IS3 family transposase [Bifidobacterium thermophilum]AGH40594.1 transposase for insertion sequence element IS3 family protein [Bifidobacterium thermophilum RBL67]MDW8486427.1 IS3 family transposase [Bifidobacterium thermophilum]